MLYKHIMNKILDITEKDKIIGEIYVITNTVNNKKYVGQTRSHRLNHNKYRPFGYMGRFKDHINECYTKKQSGSKYLNSALLKYKVETFTCEKILECSIDELDNYEVHYIKEYNTMYPNGYNLTSGGRSGRYVRPDRTFNSTADRPKNTKRSEETKKKMSESLTAYYENNEKYRLKRMKLSQAQHNKKKFEKFRNVTVDESNIEKYLHYVKNNKMNYTAVRVKINNVRTEFVGKHETLEETKTRALNFIKELIEWRHNQTAGKS
jgi:hypothetical protein